MKLDLRDKLDHLAKMETQESWDLRALLDHLEMLVYLDLLESRERWDLLEFPDLMELSDLRVTSVSPEVEVNVDNLDLLDQLAHKVFKDPLDSLVLWVRLESPDPQVLLEDKDPWDPQDPLDQRVTKDLRELRATLESLATQDLRDPQEIRVNPVHVDLMV